MGRKGIYKRTFWIRKENKYWSIAILYQYYDRTYKIEYFGYNGRDCYHFVDIIKEVVENGKFDYYVWDESYGEWVHCDEPEVYLRSTGYRRMPEIDRGYVRVISVDEFCEDTDLYSYER